MFEAYITNTALYPLMGIEVGTTVHFPTTTQELQAALAKIGIDGKRYSEVFFTSFDSDVLGLYDPSFAMRARLPCRTLRIAAMSFSSSLALASI